MHITCKSHQYLSFSRQYLRRPLASSLLIYTPTHIMSGFKNFTIVGAGNVGGFIVEELLKQKAAGSINEISIVSRPVRPVAYSVVSQGS